MKDTASSGVSAADSLGSPAIRDNAIEISPTGRTKSTHPVSIAPRGVPANFAEPGSCAKTTPPASEIDRAPGAPAKPAPERITATAFDPWHWASDRKNRSIEDPATPRGSAINE